MDRVRCYRLKHYYDLVNRKPEQERFLFGWYKKAFFISLMVNESSIISKSPFYRLLGSQIEIHLVFNRWILFELTDMIVIYIMKDYQSKSSFTKYSIIHREKGFNSYKSYFEDVNHDIWEEVVENIIRYEPEWVGYTSYTLIYQV